MSRTNERILRARPERSEAGNAYVDETHGLIAVITDDYTSISDGDCFDVRFHLPSDGTEKAVQNSLSKSLAIRFLNRQAAPWEVERLQPSRTSVLTHENVDFVEEKLDFDQQRAQAALERRELIAYNTSAQFYDFQTPIEAYVANLEQIRMMRAYFNGLRE